MLGLNAVASKRRVVVSNTNIDWHTNAQLIIISIKFIICYSPPFMCNLAEIIFTNWMSTADLATFMVDTSNLLVVAHRFVLQ
jgi:hypothetical protein